jgi:hypothetical protein
MVIAIGAVLPTPQKSPLCLSFGIADNRKDGLMIQVVVVYQVTTI